MTDEAAEPEPEPEPGAGEVTHCALPVSAVFASLLRDGVQVDEVVVRSNRQQSAICRQKRRIVGHRFLQPVLVLVQGRRATELTLGEAHHGQLLVAVGVDGHQVGGLGIQDVPPDDRDQGENKQLRTLRVT